jgi:hypothetical protein
MADNEIKQTVVIEARLAKIESELNKLRGSFKSTFDGIQKAANVALGGIGVGLSVGGIASFLNDVAELGDKLSDLSDQTGISIETLGGLRVSAEQNGITIDDLATSILKAQRTLGQMDAEGEGAAKTLQRLGLNVREMQNASPDEFFERIATKLADVANRNDRAAIATDFFGKSGARANAAILAWVEGGMTKLDASTSLAYKRLGDLKDQIVRLTAAVYDFTARGLNNMLQALGAVPSSVEQLEARLAHLQKFAPGDIGAQQRVQSELEEARKREAQPKPKPAAFQGLGVKSTGAGAKDTGVEDFFAGLQKQIDQIDIEFTKLRDGDKIAKEIALDLELVEFNQKRVAEGKKIASIDEFRKYKEIIVAANDELEKLKATKELFEVQQNLAIKAIDTSTPLGKEQARIAQIETEFARTVKKLDELGKKAGQKQEEIAANVSVAWKGALNEINQTRDQALKDLEELRTELKIGAIDQRTPEGKEQFRIATIEVEFVKTAKRITELGEAAGQNQEQIAEDVALAWQKSLREIQNTTDEITEFQRRAMERAFDAMTDLTKDALGGQIKSWEDFGNRVKKVIDELVSEFLVLQLKTAALGPDFGSKSGGTGQLGGFIGQLLGLFGAAGGASPATGTLATAQASLGFDPYVGLAAGLAGGYHTGGVVGRDGTPRPVLASVFKNAKRYHMGGIPGLKQDEVPAILLKGERVIPRGGAMPSRGAPVVNMTVVTKDAGSFQASQRSIATKLNNQIARMG